jgi:Lysyl oxidase
VLGTATAATVGADGTPGLGVPNLDPVAPYSVSVFRDSRGRHRIAFASATENRGEWPLVIVGTRPSRRTPTMTATQLVDPADGDGPQTSFRRVGVLRCTIAQEPGHADDHQHWHLLGFMRYELRRASDFRRVSRDRKTGFCLGDRYGVGSGAAAARVRSRDFDPDCGKFAPRRLRVVEGISPGFGDDYKPRLEGQSLEVTGLPSGRYVLVHRANPDRTVRETRYDDNASSVLLSLQRRPGRAPAIRVLARCQGTSRCPAAG